LPAVKSCYKPLLIILVPISLIYGFSTIRFVGQIFDSFYLLESGKSLNDFMPIIFAYSKLIGIALLVAIVAVAAKVVVINFMASQLFPNQQQWDLKETLKASMGNIILAMLLEVLIEVGILIIFAVVIGLSVFIATSISVGLGVFLSVILYLGIYVVMIWLIVSFSLYPFAIIMEGLGPWQALKKSFNLIRKNWWRFFGIGLLFSMMISFAMSLVTSPIIILSIVPAISDMFVNANSYMDDIEILMSFLEVFRSPGFAIMLSLTMLIQFFGQTLVWNVFQSLFYVDLKVRKEELTVEEDKLPNE
jgi:hypothetical protein